MKPWGYYRSEPQKVLNASHISKETLTNRLSTSCLLVTSVTLDKTAFF